MRMRLCGTALRMYQKHCRVSAIEVLRPWREQVEDVSYGHCQASSACIVLVESHRKRKAALQER